MLALRTVDLVVHDVPQDAAVHEPDKQHVAVVRQRLLQVVKAWRSGIASAMRCCRLSQRSPTEEGGQCKPHVLLRTRSLNSSGVVMRAWVGSLLHTSLL